MGTNFILRFREHLIQNLVALILLPLLAFMFIFICYGDEFHQIFEAKTELIRLYELTSLKKFITEVSLLPAHLVKLSFALIIYSYILYSIWFALFAYSCYDQVSHEKHNYFALGAEYAVLMAIFFFVIRPGLSIILQIIGWFLFALVMSIVIVYAIVYYRRKHEKK